MLDRVLLTGASGLLGTWLRRKTPAGTELVSLVHRTAVPEGTVVSADLRDGSAFAAVVADVRPSLVLHAAYDKDRESIVEATGNVVEAAAAVGAAVLLVSTDVVFAGDGTPRGEDAAVDPVLDYGRWKVEAEALVHAGSETSAIVRLPLVVSLDPPDHVIGQIQRGASRGEPTAWFTDELRQPAWASELAEGLWRIAELDGAARAGVWHLPGPETLSRHEIAVRVVDRLGLDPRSITGNRRPSQIARPRHLDLTAARAKEAIGWAPSTILS